MHWWIPAIMWLDQHYFSGKIIDWQSFAWKCIVFVTCLYGIVGTWLHCLCHHRWVNKRLRMQTRCPKTIRSQSLLKGLNCGWFLLIWMVYPLFQMHPVIKKNMILETNYLRWEWEMNHIPINESQKYWKKEEAGSLTSRKAI